MEQSKTERKDKQVTAYGLWSNKWRQWYIDRQSGMFVAPNLAIAIAQLWNLGGISSRTDFEVRSFDEWLKEYYDADISIVIHGLEARDVKRYRIREIVNKQEQCLLKK